MNNSCTVPFQKAKVHCTFSKSLGEFKVTFETKQFTLWKLDKFCKCLTIYQSQNEKFYEAENRRGATLTCNSKNFERIIYVLHEFISFSEIALSFPLFLLLSVFCHHYPFNPSKMLRINLWISKINRALSQNESMQFLKLKSFLKIVA